MAAESREVEGKLVESFKLEGLGSLAAEYAELGLDAILDDNIAKDIPILSTVIGMVKVGFDIKGRIYLKKVASFLSPIGETTQQEREEFVREHCDNIKRFEETIMLILEHADRIEKTNLIGKVFKACILREITYAEALKLSHMINRAFWGDLQQLIENEKVQINEHNQSLIDAGLFEMSISGGGHRARYNRASVKYQISDYGRQIFRIASQ